MYKFKQELQEGILVRRSSRFTMDVLIDDEIIKCHCPTTGRIGNIELKNIACLISHSDNIKRKLSYTVEAISCDELDKKEKNWIGINQILSNRLIEFFLKNHELDAMISDFDEIKQEVKLGNSKLDFLVGNTYIEVKTPLTTIHVKYGENIKEKPTTPFSSTERFTKHINELYVSLDSHERAILLTVYQYNMTEVKPHQKSTHFTEVHNAMENAIEKGVETWNINFLFTPKGVYLLNYQNTTNNIMF